VRRLTGIGDTRLRLARAEIPDAIDPDVVFRLFRDKQRRLRHGAAPASSGTTTSL
jgi:hypothetical protein